MSDVDGACGIAGEASDRVKLLNHDSSIDGGVSPVARARESRTILETAHSSDVSRSWRYCAAITKVEPEKASTRRMINTLSKIRID